MRPLILAITAAAFLSIGDDKPAVKDAEGLKGIWTMVSVTVDGTTGTEEQVRSARLVVEGDRFTPTFDGNAIPCTFALDPTARPKTIDLTYTTGDVKGLTVKGIYRLQGDTFVICRTLRPKDERPTEFASDSGSMLVMATWTRSKP